MLAPALGHHAADRPAIFEEGTIGELLPAIARDEFLHHDLSRPDQAERRGEALHQLGPRVCPPGLGLGCVDEVLFDSRFDGKGRLGVDLI